MPDLKKEFDISENIQPLDLRNFSSFPSASIAIPIIAKKLQREKKTTSRMPRLSKNKQSSMNYHREISPEEAELLRRIQDKSLFDFESAKRIC